MPSLNVRNFPRELLQRIKIQSAIEGTTGRDLVIRAVERYLEGKNTGEKKKRPVAARKQ